MTDDPLTPEAGDIVWVDLEPTRGREQSGVRPAIVLSDRTFHQRNATAIICPITRNIAPWPTKVLLPVGSACPALFSSIRFDASIADRAASDASARYRTRFSFASV